MTMHDEHDLELLERDLRELAEPREDDERIRFAVRSQLGTRVRPRPRRWVSRRIAFGAGAVGVAAATAAVLALVAGPSGSGGPSAADAAVVHHALVAVTPPAGDILHTEVTGVQGGVTFVNDVWRQTAPPYAGRAMKDHEEFSDNGTTSSEYDPATNTVYEQPDSSSPSPFTDPVAQVRHQLASGQAQVDGTVVVGGSSVYKIDLPQGFVGYFDTRDYAPRYIDVPQQDGTVLRLRFVVYDYLPMTPANEALLSVAAQHPSARIDTNPSDAPQPGSY